TESYCWYGYFEIIVFAGSVAGEQLQRPPGRDVPRGGHRRHSLCDFTGRPSFPEFVDLGDGELPPGHAQASGSGLAVARRWTRKRSTPGYFSPRDVTAKLLAVYKPTASWSVSATIGSPAGTARRTAPSNRVPTPAFRACGEVATWSR